MESNDTYPYFNLLTNNIRASLTIIDKRYNSCLRLRHLTNSLNITALIILIYGFIKYYPEPFNLMYCMISSSIISYLGVVIMNKPEEDLEKACKNLKSLLLLNVCDCEHNCHCRRRIGEFLRERHISL